MFCNKFNFYLCYFYGIWSVFKRLRYHIQYLVFPFNMRSFTLHMIEYNLSWKCNIYHFLYCFSQVYWLGDLNYRITDLDPKIVKDMVDKANYKPVLEYDQLRQQHRIQAVFAGYQEGEILFRPTYKYDPGSDEWDSR